MDGACFREWARLMHGQANDLFAVSVCACSIPSAAFQYDVSDVKQGVIWVTLK